MNGEQKRLLSVFDPSSPNLNLLVSWCSAITGAAMRALEVLAIYLTPFLILGAAIKFWMKRHAIDLRDAQGQAGGAPRRRFLLGAWRTEE